MKTLTIHDAIQRLNYLLEVDKDAITSLFRTRIPCNSVLASNPSVPVSAGSRIGPMGVINALFSDKDGSIAMRTTVTGDIHSFVFNPCKEGESKMPGNIQDS